MNPWDSDKQMKNALYVAGWRYAALIGFVESDTLSLQQYEEDKILYSELIKKRDDRPVWDERDGVYFGFCRIN